MKTFKIIKIILLSLSTLFYYMSYQLECIFLNMTEVTFLGGKASVILVCDICLTLAILLLLIIITLILIFEKNELKASGIIGILLISLTTLCYLGSHLLEALSQYMIGCCILGIKMPIKLVCNICLILSLAIPLIIICLIIIFERKTRLKNKSL